MVAQSANLSIILNNLPPQVEVKQFAFWFFISFQVCPSVLVLIHSSRVLPSLAMYFPPFIQLQYSLRGSKNICHWKVSKTVRSNAHSLTPFVQDTLQPFQAQWSLYVPPRLTLKNSTFCPHSVFMCFLRISEQTAIISRYLLTYLLHGAESLLKS